MFFSLLVNQGLDTFHSSHCGTRDCRGRDRMIVGTTYAIGTYHH